MCCLCPGQWTVAFRKQLVSVSVKPNPKDGKQQLGQPEIGKNFQHSKHLGSGREG